MEGSNLRTPSQSDIFARRMAEKASERSLEHLKEIAIADETKAKAPLTILFDWYADYSEEELSQFARPRTDREDKDHPEWKDEPFPDYYSIVIGGDTINTSFYDAMADDTAWGQVCVAHCDAITASKVDGASCPDNFRKLDKSARDFEWTWLIDDAARDMGRITTVETKWKKRRNRNRSSYRRAGEVMFQEQSLLSMGTVGLDYKTERDPKGAKDDTGNIIMVPASSDKQIVVYDNPAEGEKISKSFKNVGISTFLQFDVELAKLNGNNLSALLATVKRGTPSDEVAIEEQEATVTVGMKLSEGEAALALLNHWTTPAVEKSLWHRLNSKKPEDSDDLARTLYDLASFFGQFGSSKMRQRIEALNAKDAEDANKASTGANVAA